MTAPGPLAGLVVAAAPGRSAEVAVAAWLLTTMGAEVAPPGGTAADVTLAVAEDAAVAGESPGGPEARAELVGSGPAPAGNPVGVPEGTVTYAVGVALAAGALAAVLGRAAVEVRAADVALQLFLPPVMAAAYSSPTWPAPPGPEALPGEGGWLSCELGAPGDRERYELLRSTLPPDLGAAEVACSAQAWRLAVCDYRARPSRKPEGPALPRSGPVRLVGGGEGSAGGRPRPRDAGDAPLAGITVCDLTAMWAGPLCTWLLGRLGATVWKVEPEVRPDGMRALDGRGVHPGGRSTAPGSDSGLFHALNSGKQRADWDLRRPADRRRLLELVEGSDLVVDSFSPRVMPNLGLTRDELAVGHPGLLTLSVPAFPPGPLRDWVAYGTGVHAVSGLGTLPAGPVPYAAPAVTYPDALAGLVAAAAALAGLVGRERGWAPVALEVALLSAVTPLLDLGAPHPALAGRDPDLGRALVEAAGPDAFELLEVAGQKLPHPVGPFRA